MNVSLTPELEKFVQQKVQSGRYHSASEVVREALQLLADKELVRNARLERLRNEIQLGLDEMERGEVVTAEELFSELERRQEEREARGPMA